jgi:hypothetical protein
LEFGFWHSAFRPLISNNHFTQRIEYSQKWKPSAVFRSSALGLIRKRIEDYSLRTALPDAVLKYIFGTAAPTVADFLMYFRLCR